MHNSTLQHFEIPHTFTETREYFTQNQGQPCVNELVGQGTQSYFTNKGLLLLRQPIIM